MTVRGEMTEARRAEIMLAITIAAAGKSGAINHTRSGGEVTMAMSAIINRKRTKDRNVPIAVPTTASQVALFTTRKTMESMQSCGLG
jgi:uncharacterized membrane protein